MRKKTHSGSRVGDELVSAVQEMAAYLRGEIECESYEIDDDVITPARVKGIRRKVATSTIEFERRFGIKARTMEAYEAGRRKPDAAMTLLLRILEREPDAVRRAASGNNAMPATQPPAPKRRVEHRSGRRVPA